MCVSEEMTSHGALSDGALLACLPALPVANCMQTRTDVSPVHAAGEQQSCRASAAVLVQQHSWAAARGDRHSSQQVHASAASHGQPLCMPRVIWSPLAACMPTTTILSAALHAQPAILRPDHVCCRPHPDERSPEAPANECQAARSGPAVSCSAGGLWLPGSCCCIAPVMDLRNMCTSWLHASMCPPLTRLR